MLIDWFTVGAQIVNFLVLVWLLKRYLYRPILAAIDAREREIAAKIESARVAKEEAERLRKEVNQQRESLEHQRLSLLSTAQDEAKTEGTRLLAQGEHEMDEMRAARLRDLEKEIADYQDELVRLVRGEIVANVRKLVGDLASADLEQATTGAFLRRLDALPAAKTSNGNDLATSVRLLSAFPLTPEQQQQIAQDIHQHFGVSTPPVFEIDPNLLLGFELTVGDQKTAWSVDSYLDTFKKRLADLSAPKANPAPA